MAKSRALGVLGTPEAELSLESKRARLEILKVGRVTGRARTREVWHRVLTRNLQLEFLSGLHLYILSSFPFLKISVGLQLRRR